MARCDTSCFTRQEIAAEPAVIDARALAAHYASIGVRTRNSGGYQMFETQAAAAAGERARQELINKESEDRARHVNRSPGPRASFATRVVDEIPNPPDAAGDTFTAC